MVETSKSTTPTALHRLHYTDTHGYTESNFVEFVMVDMRFCPRSRDRSAQVRSPGWEPGTLTTASSNLATSPQRNRAASLPSSAGSDSLDPKST